jgi:clan AA aspartic protease
MGRTLLKAHVTNVVDVLAVTTNSKQSSDVRAIDVEFLVDTGAAMLCLPSSIIKQLGLVQYNEATVHTANGIVQRHIYSPVRIEVLDRHATLDVMENDDDTLPLLGYIPLEMMDLQVNPKEQVVMPNPANNGKWLIDLF